MLCTPFARSGGMELGRVWELWERRGEDEVFFGW